MESMYLLIGLLVGLAAGSTAVWFFMTRRSNADNPVALKAAHDRYRDEVADHFAETASLVNQMTDSYKQVFDHLQSSAHSLIDEERRQDRLGSPDGETITLHRLGQQPRAASREMHKPAPQIKADYATDPAEPADSGPSGSKASDHKPGL